MSEIFFKACFVSLFVIYILIRVPFANTYKQGVIIKTVNSSGEKILLALMSLGLLLIPLLWLFTPFLENFKIGFPVWLRLLGISISVASLFYFRWIHKALGENWSPTLEIIEGHRLVKSGPYKTIRHPMYAQIFLWTIAQILIVSNWIAGFSGVVAFAILYFIRVPQEEKMLTENFGDEYIRYMKDTGRIFPNLLWIKPIKESS